MEEWVDRHLSSWHIQSYHSLISHLSIFFRTLTLVPTTTTTMILMDPTTTLDLIHTDLTTTWVSHQAQTSVLPPSLSPHSQRALLHFLSSLPEQQLWIWLLRWSKYLTISGPELALTIELTIISPPSLILLAVQQQLFLLRKWQQQLLFWWIWKWQQQVIWWIWSEYKI